MALICSFVLYVSYNALSSPTHLHALLALYIYPLLINAIIFLATLAIVQSRRTEDWPCIPRDSETCH